MNLYKMEIFSSDSVNTKEGTLEFFHSAKYQSMCIRNNNNKKVFPFIDYAQTFLNYILIKSNDRWGVLDVELHTVIPATFDSLYPVMQIDVNDFVEKSLESQMSNVNDEYSENENMLYFITGRNNENSLYNVSLHEIPYFDETFEITDRIFKVVNLEECSLTTFIATYNNDEIYLLSIENGIVESFKRNSFFRIQHAIDDVFVSSDINNTDGLYQIKVFGRYGFVNATENKKTDKNTFIDETNFTNSISYNDNYYSFKYYHGGWVLYKLLKEEDNHSVF